MYIPSHPYGLFFPVLVFNYTYVSVDVNIYDLRSFVLYSPIVELYFNLLSLRIAVTIVTMYSCYYNSFFTLLYYYICYLLVIIKDLSGRNVIVVFVD